MDRSKNKIYTSYPDDQLITMKFGDLSRLLAWYGSLRFVAARDGCGGSLESPGEFVVNKVEDI